MIAIISSIVKTKICKCCKFFFISDTIYRGGGCSIVILLSASFRGYLQWWICHEFLSKWINFKSFFSGSLLPSLCQAWSSHIHASFNLCTKSLYKPQHLSQLLHFKYKYSKVNPLFPYISISWDTSNCALKFFGGSLWYQDIPQKIWGQLCLLNLLSRSLQNVGILPTDIASLLKVIFFTFHREQIY